MHVTCEPRRSDGMDGTGMRESGGGARGPQMEVKKESLHKLESRFGLRYDDYS
jgi:hypothetical protein